VGGIAFMSGGRFNGLKKTGKTSFRFSISGKVVESPKKQTKECDISSKYQTSIVAYIFGSLPTIFSKSLNFNFAQERD